MAVMEQSRIIQCPACHEIYEDDGGTIPSHECDPARVRAVAMGEDPEEVEVVDPDNQIGKFKAHESLMGAGLLAKRRTSSTPKKDAKLKAKLKRRKKRRAKGR